MRKLNFTYRNVYAKPSGNLIHGSITCSSVKEAHDVSSYRIGYDTMVKEVIVCFTPVIKIEDVKGERTR